MHRWIYLHMGGFTAKPHGHQNCGTDAKMLIPNCETTPDGSDASKIAELDDSMVKVI